MKTVHPVPFRSQWLPHRADCRAGSPFLTLRPLSSFLERSRTSGGLQPGRGKSRTWFWGHSWTWTPSSFPVPLSWDVGGHIQETPSSSPLSLFQGLPTGQPFFHHWGVPEHGLSPGQQGDCGVLSPASGPAGSFQFCFFSDSCPLKICYLYQIYSQKSDSRKPPKGKKCFYDHSLISHKLWAFLGINDSSLAGSCSALMVTEGKNPS